MDQVEVAEDAVDHERHRIDQVVRPELLDRRRPDRVEDVTEDHRRRDDHDHLVEQLGAVVHEDAAVARRALLEQRQLVATLAEPEKEREQQRA